MFLFHLFIFLLHYVCLMFVLCFVLCLFLFYASDFFIFFYFYVYEGGLHRCWSRVGALGDCREGLRRHSPAIHGRGQDHPTSAPCRHPNLAGHRVAILPRDRHGSREGGEGQAPQIK